MIHCLLARSVLCKTSIVSKSIGMIVSKVSIIVRCTVVLMAQKMSFCISATIRFFVCYFVSDVTGSSTSWCPISTVASISISAMFKNHVLQGFSFWESETIPRTLTALACSDPRNQERLKARSHPHFLFMTKNVQCLLTLVHQTNGSVWNGNFQTSSGKDYA